MIELEIDSNPIQVAEGTTVIEAANQLGIYVPHFCYHKKLSIAANCRMCLVEIAKAPKPLPACATPATNGMKVRTHSALAVDAQKGVMEFLLINHPLDCPVCDEGGECQLQDLAVGYGASSSLYDEAKRSVPNKFLGPLIATEMTRCIHCTRCVRFGVEIAGMMELGMAGRGEAAEILAFVGRTVNSELSGNMIDVCPVGALTSKPFRFTARAWELSNKKSVSPHCGLGSNLLVQTKLNRVYRVLPAENEAINECWLSDKDRFSYEGLNSNERLRQPMIKRDGEWKTCDWPQAFQFIASCLKAIVDKDGAQHIAALATAHQTLEELYLLQKLMRALGSGNVDFRLRQSDFTLDGALKGAPWLGMPVASLPGLKRILLLGANLRHDHPLIAARIRKAVKWGARVSVINPHDNDLLMPLAHKLIVAPSLMVEALEQVLNPRQQNQTAQAIAASLRETQPSAILLGNLAQHHPHASRLLEIAQNLAQATGANLGFLGEAANSVGGYLAKATPVAAVPHGMNCAEMLRNPRRACLLLGVEPELDCHDPGLAMAAMREAHLVVAMSAYRHKAVDYAHVMLPIAPFTETAGTFVNTEGRAQSFTAAVSPLAETRPAWKVLRVLANSLRLTGFDYDTVEEIRAEIAVHEVPLNNAIAASAQGERTVLQKTERGIERIADVPIYFADAIVRRSPSLQETDDARAPTAMMNGSLIERLGLREGQNARFRQGDGQAIALVARDDRLPANCVRLACAHPLTSNLGPMFGAISVEPAP